MEALALRGEKTGDAGRVVGRLDELDLRFADGQEGDPHPILGDVRDRLELEPEQVAPDAERLLDRADDQGDMVDPAEASDAIRHAGRRTRDGHRRAPQTVISSRWTPNEDRSRSLISPTVA